MESVYNHRNIREILRRNWFLFGVLLCIFLAELFPGLGATGGVFHPEWTAKYLAVGLIFFISGISLKFDDLVVAASSYKVHWFVQCFTFILIPAMIQVLCALLWLLFGVNEWLLKGLMSVSCMPPPVSSAVILTRTIGGNEAAAIFNSVLGSFLGILITPIALFFFLGSTALVSMIDSVVILAQTVVIPLAVGLSLRHFGLIKNVHNMHLSASGQALLLFIIFTTFCDVFITHDAPMNASDVLVSVLLVVSVQLLFLYVSFHLAQHMNIYSASDIVAITFCSTHKSLTLGIPIMRILFSGFSHFSQISLPLLIYHPTQIILGGLLVPPFKKWLYFNRSRYIFA